MSGPGQTLNFTCAEPYDNQQTAIAIVIAICYRDCRKGGGGAGRRAFLKKKLKHEFKEPEDGLWHD